MKQVDTQAPSGRGIPRSQNGAPASAQRRRGATARAFRPRSPPASRRSLPESHPADPAGARSAKPTRALSYSRCTCTRAPGNSPATASLIEARAAAASAPSSSWTMMPTMRAGSRSASDPGVVALAALRGQRRVEISDGQGRGSGLRRGSRSRDQGRGHGRRARDGERARADKRQEDSWFLH